MNRYPSYDEFPCPLYKCKDCKWFKSIDASEPYGCTHRFNHAFMEYAHPYFNSHPEECGYPCSDFEPNGLYKAALPHWHGYEHWRRWQKKQDIESLYESWGQDFDRRYKLLKNATPEPYIAFFLKVNIDKYKSAWRNHYYYVKLKDYVYNTIFETDGVTLKAYKHWYLKSDKNSKGYGYRGGKESIKGVNILTGEVIKDGCVKSM